MKNKIVKYIKLIISMTLILSLIAPSYASLSASDGSAFVTKAEFDSALADFNARLTTFEAGINSKIDSQVTSYLDRNGIWSGKIQVINTDATGACQWQGQFKSLSPTSGTVCSDSRVGEVTAITNVSKSGMCLMNVAYSSLSTAASGYTSSRCGYTFKLNDGYNWFCNAGMAVRLSFLSSDAANQTTGELILNEYIIGAYAGSVRNSSENTYGYLLVPLPLADNPASFFTTFFVSKGSKIIVALNVHAHFSQTSSISLEGKMTYSIKSAVVY